MEARVMIDACRAIIAWNWQKHGSDAPNGAVGIGPYFGRGEPDWTEPYDCTGGAAYVFRRELSGVEQDFHVMRDYYMLIHDYGLDPHLVHRAFLELKEFEFIINAMNHGAYEDSHAREFGYEYGRNDRRHLQNLTVFEKNGAVHVWPDRRIIASGVFA
jgi:hypothetical protein